VSFALALQLKLRQKLPIYHIELNEPYKGTDDGFTTFLRTRFADARYAGIEIEINQKYYGTTTMTMIQEQLMNAIQDVIVGRH
jgi:hypothetical protein